MKIKLKKERKKKRSYLGPSTYRRCYSLLDSCICSFSKYEKGSESSKVQYSFTYIYIVCDSYLFMFATKK